MMMLEAHLGWEALHDGVDLRLWDGHLAEETLPGALDGAV